MGWRRFWNLVRRFEIRCMGLAPSTLNMVSLYTIRLISLIPSFFCLVDLDNWRSYSSHDGPLYTPRASCLMDAAVRLGALLVPGAVRLGWGWGLVGCCGLRLVPSSLVQFGPSRLKGKFAPNKARSKDNKASSIGRGCLAHALQCVAGTRVHGFGQEEKAHEAKKHYCSKQ